MVRELNNKNPRRIACTRCRARKKRCDHEVPTCGECKKSGSECVQFGTRRFGSFATVPIAYLQQLESQLSRARNSQRTDDGLPNEGLDLQDADDGAGFVDENDYTFPFVNAGNQRQSLSCPEGSTADTDSASNDMRLEDHLDPSLGPYRTLPDIQHGLSEPASPLSGASDLRPHTRSSANSVSGASAPAGRDTVLSIGEDWLDHYAHTYFRHVQPQWLFVDEEAWRKSYATWKRAPREVMPSHKFLMQLLLAV
ncbi:binuclear zinc transcription factor, partial [Colletotrichum musicola]